MTRLFLFSFLILFASASCTVSKRQHLSGYHVDLHPALKKNTPKSHTSANSKDNLAINHDQLKDIKPLAKQKAPFNQSSLFATSQQDFPTVEETSPRRLNNSRQEINNPLILEGKKPRQVDKPNLPAAPAKAQAHQAFLIAAGILLLLSVVFYAILITTAASSPASLFLAISSAFGLYLSLILFVIALLIGFILFLIYLGEKE